MLRARRSRRVCFLTIAIAISCAALTILPTAASAQWKPNIEYLTVYSGSLGGGWHPVGALTAEIIHEAIPALTTKVGPGGGTANPQLIQSGKGLVGMTYTGTQDDAYRGVADFNTPHKDIRHVISMYSIPFWWVVRKDSDITSVAHLANKRISPGRIGQTGLHVSTESLKAYGITFESIKAKGGMVSLLGDQERLDSLRDRHVDAISGLFPLNFSGLLSLKLTPGVRIIGLDRERIKKVMEVIPSLGEVKVSKGTFDKDQTEDLYTVTAVTSLICHASLEDELVYRIAKAMVEGKKRYNPYFLELDNTMDTPLIGNTIPVHPGAMKYYKERGWAK